MQGVVLTNCRLLDLPLRLQPAAELPALAAVQVIIS